MNEKGFSTIYTTYDKTLAVSLLTALKENNIKIIYRTSTETTSEDVLYEISVTDNDINRSHDILLNLRLNNQE